MEGVWIAGKQELENMVVQFFTDLYTLPSTKDIISPLPRRGFVRIPNMELLQLMEPFSNKEIWDAVYRMKAYKAPGIDGYDLFFYHKCWDTVSDSVCNIRWASRGVVCGGIRWNVRNGKHARFWEDPWLDNSSLLSLDAAPVDPTLLNKKVFEFWLPSFGWNWELINQLLLVSILMRHAAMSLRQHVGIGDVIRWGHTFDEMYSAKSAYMLICPETHIDNQKAYPVRLVWRILVSEQIRHFLWLGIHGKLMTNAERFRRHFMNDPRCTACGYNEESLPYVFRDSEKAKSVWLLFLTKQQLGRVDFFVLDPIEWLKAGLKGTFSFSQTFPGEVMFVVILWWLWRWRNGRVFGNIIPVADIRWFLLNQTKEFAEVMMRSTTSSSLRSRAERLISWSRPSPGWMTVNTYGVK
ncbi:hypothetical protein V2J09_018741 [Rumex salicifolius]